MRDSELALVGVLRVVLMDWLLGYVEWVVESWLGLLGLLDV